MRTLLGASSQEGWQVPLALTFRTEFFRLRANCYFEAMVSWAFLLTSASPLLADKFMNTGSDGKVTGKAETLATAKATKYDSADYDDVKVTVFGDAAIAMGGFEAKGTDASGKPLDVHERWTDTWVKMPKGQWQCVASHQSLVKI